MPRRGMGVEIHRNRKPLRMNIVMPRRGMGVEMRRGAGVFIGF